MLTKNVSYDRRPDRVEAFPYGSSKRCRVDFPVNIREDDEGFLADVYSIELPYYDNMVEIINRNYEGWFDKAKTIGDDVLK